MRSAKSYPARGRPRQARGFDPAASLNPSSSASCEQLSVFEPPGGFLGALAAPGFGTPREYLLLAMSAAYDLSYLVSLPPKAISKRAKIVPGTADGRGL